MNLIIIFGVFSGFLFFSDSSTSKLINEDNNNYHPRSIKPVKNTRSQIIPSISLATMQDDHDYDERKYMSNQIDWLRLIIFVAPCPSFDLHLYAHIDHSSLNRCVFTPIPHQTSKNTIWFLKTKKLIKIILVSQDEQSQQIFEIGQVEPQNLQTSSVE